MRSPPELALFLERLTSSFVPCMRRVVPAALPALCLAAAYSPKADDQATPAGWTRHLIAAGAYSIAIPPEVRGGREQGVDSLVAAYRSADFRISLDFGMYGGRPDCGAYQCSPIEIDGVPATLTRGEEPAWPDEPGMTHRLHLYVPLADPAGSDRLSLVAVAHCATACEAAERIFRTLDFNLEARRRLQ